MKHVFQRVERGVICSVIVLGLFISLPSWGRASNNDTLCLSRLFELMHADNRDGPLFALGGFEKSYHPALFTANMEYFKSHQELLKKIHEDLGSQAIKWRLETLRHRLLYVPEQQPEYIGLYERYCQNTIAEILSLAALPNPYSQIITLSDKPPSTGPTDGIRAYIVHNLTTEFRAKYEFTSESAQKVMIELSGRYLSGEIGSYSSFLQFDKAGKVFFTHDRFTVWQNNAKNPYTALMTPVEETFHVLLRKSTEAAIKAAVEERGTRSVKEARQIVEEWISVEEAIVGGLVYHMLPPILERRMGTLPVALVSRDVETKNEIAKYHYLKKGIQVVGHLGYKACLDLYLNNPIAFRDLL